MDCLRLRRTIRIPLSKILLLQQFSSLNTILLIGYCSKQPGKPCLLVINANSAKIIRRFYLTAESATKGLGFEIEAKNHSICQWNASKGLVEILKFPCFHKPLIRLQGIQSIICVTHYLTKKLLFIACETNTVKCYRMSNGEFQSKLTLKRDQEIRQMKTLEAKEWLLIRTRTSVFTACMKTNTVLTSIEIYKPPKIGTLQSFVHSLVGCTGDSKKLVLTNQETSSVDERGISTKDYSIEVYSLADLRKDYRIPLESEPRFASVSNETGSVIWAERQKIKSLDKKSKEVAELLTVKEKILAGLVSSRQKYHHCNNNFATAKTKHSESPSSSNNMTMLIAFRKKLAVLSLSKGVGRSSDGCQLA